MVKSMNTASIEQIKSWLSQVVDPEIPVVSIEEMGLNDVTMRVLKRSVSINSDGICTVTSSVK